MARIIVMENIQQGSNLNNNSAPMGRTEPQTLCAVCRDKGTCPLCLEKKATELNTGVEYGESVASESQSLQKNSELQEIKVESPTHSSNGISSHPMHSANQGGDGKTFTIQVEKSNKDPEKKKDERKWLYFQGKNRFFCNGRLITAPSISFCFCCFLLILVTFSLFIVFDGPYLAKNWSLGVPIGGSILFLIVIVSMMKTTFSDPGIIPRASQQEVEYLERCYTTNNVSRPPPRTKDIIVNGQVVKVKYCFTCKMFRPPRASHCGVCDNCVDRFDHHCPFLGNCIGKRNYRHFYSFVVSLSFLSVFVLSCATAHLILISKDKGNFLEALKESPTSAIVVIISFFGMWTVLGLSGFHTYLISVEQTTNEDIKGVYGRSAAKNPYSRGNIFRNCTYILCGPLQPSLVDPRGIVTADFLASLPKKNETNTPLQSTICNRGQHMGVSAPRTISQPAAAAYRPNSLVTHTQNHLPPSSASQNLLLSNSPNCQTIEEYPNSLSATKPKSPVSPDSGHLLTSASSNRSLGEVTSESLRNLYEDDDSLSPDSGSESHVSFPQSNAKNGISISRYNPRSNDFDDPTIVPMGLTSRSMGSDLVLDMDDPLMAHDPERIRKFSAPRKTHQGRAGGDSAISLPSTFASAGGSNGSRSKTKGQSGSRGRSRIGSSDQASTVASGNKALSNHSSKSMQGALNKRSKKDLSSSSSTHSLPFHTRSSGRLSKSTMIDSPLDLDTVT